MSAKKDPGLALGESVSTKPKNGVNAWVVAILMLLATVVIYMASKKLNPCMASLVEYFGMDTAWGGGLGSIYSICSAILLLPLGVLATKFSPKWIAVIGLIILGGGSIMGAFLDNPGVFYVTRVIEGVGYCALSAIGGVLITRWFDEAHRGIPMGIFTCNVGLGQVVILNAAPPIMHSFGWQGVWIFVGVVALVIMLLVAFLVKDWPRGGETEALKEAEENAKKNEKKAKFTDTFKVPVLWLMALMFACFGVGMQGTMMFSNMILTQVAGVTNETASLMSSVMAIGQMVGPIIGGAIISRVCVKSKDKRGLVVALMFVMAFICEFSFLAFTNNEPSAWVTSAMMGFLVTWWAPTLYIIAADHSLSPELASVGITIFLFGQQVGGIVGPYIMGWFNAAFGTFVAAKWLILAIAIVGCIAAFAMAILDKRFVDRQSAKAIEE